MKKLTTFLLVVCASFQVFADEANLVQVREQLTKVLVEKSQDSELLLQNISKRLEATPEARKKMILGELLRKDFFFHKAADACYLPVIDFFLNQITNSNEIDDYLFTVRRPYREMLINPYQQAVISSCMDAVIQIDMRVHNLIKISLKAIQDPYSQCNSNLHLLMMSIGEQKVELNRALVQYFIKDPVAPYQKNMDGCRAVELLDDHKDKVKNYMVIRYDLETTRSGLASINEQSSDQRLEVCTSGYYAFVNPKRL